MKKLFLLFIAVLSLGIVASAQTRTVRGTVTDASNGEPLVGASVMPAGLQRGVTTDVDGNFTIQIAPDVKQLTFSYVGYTTATLPVQDKMDVKLKADSEMLETLVVTGYGSGKKLGSMTGSVAVVGSAALENITTPSFLDALQGKVSGLSVMSNSGDPSSTETAIRLRGINSLNSSNTPLFILDGAPITQTVFSTLNPNDIENITVLKDAASVAIYGSRAANGVIVITSKKGKYGEKAKVNFRAKYGWSQASSKGADVMDSKQYIKFRDLIGQPVSDEQRTAAEVYGINTDWHDEIFNNHAPMYSLEASVSGGTEKLNYYFSLNHLDQEGIFTQSGMRRETMRFSFSSRVTDWFRVGMQANLGYHKYETNEESDGIYNGSGLYLTNPVTFQYVALPMDSPRYYTVGEGGKLIYGKKAQYLHFTGLPTVDYLKSNRDMTRNRVTANANVFEEITPIKGLTIRAQQAVDAYDQRVNRKTLPHEILVTPMGDVYGVEQANDNGIITGANNQGFTRYYQFTYTNTAEYRFKVADVHTITALLGQESIIGKSEGFGVLSTGFTDRRTMLLQQGVSVDPQTGVTESVSQSAMNSYFLSASYNYDNKYFFDFNVRRDGSSYFAPGHRWATFWSVGGLWDAKQEKFLQDVTWLNAAALHVSYGTTGNSSFANYAYQGLVSTGSNYNGAPSFIIDQAANEDLSWEVVEGLDVGVDVGIFDKVDVKASFYNKNTKDLLLSIPYSYTTGVASNWGNVGSMRNTGVDLEISYRPIQTKDWYWEVHANMNYNHNEITSLYDGQSEMVFPQSGIAYKVGETANAFYMVRYAGVDPRDGKQMWYTREGNLTKVYNEERDAVAIDGKSQYAPISGGFGTNLSWKGISLQAEFTWAADKYMLNNDRYFLENSNFATQYNQSPAMLDVWTHQGQITNIPKPGEAIQFDTHLLENASFVRLKQLTVQYAFPKNIVKKLFLEDLKLHFTGRNLLTFTNYGGDDPEPETNVIAFFYPNTRQFEFGIDVSF